MCVNVIVIKHQLKTSVINENSQVTKRGEERRKTKGTELVISREMKRKIEKNHLGLAYVTLRKYLKKVFPWGIGIKEFHYVIIFLFSLEDFFFPF